MNINYQIKKLKNNIKIIYNSNTHNITTLSVFVKVGSKDETANDKGLSHFLEHMLFKGTIKRSNTKIISSELDEVGAYFNAYTDKNLTCFIIKLNSDYVNKAINILSDILLNSTFLSKNVEKEINVVIEELNKDKDNNIRVLIENIYKLLFHNNSLSYPTGGYNQDITKFNTNNVKVFWKKYYNSNNMVISVSSNLSFNNIFNKIKNSEFNNFQIGVENKCKSQNLKIGNKPKYNIISKNLEQVHLAIGFKVCNMFNKDKYVLLLIKIILAGNMSSRLFTQLRENNGLSYNIDIDLSHYETTGGFIIYTSLDKNSLIIKNINKPVSVKYMNNNDFNMLEKGAGCRWRHGPGFISCRIPRPSTAHLGASSSLGMSR